MLDGYHDSEWDFGLGTVRGYRWWQVAYQITGGPFLIGNAGGEWKSPELMAKCFGQIYTGPIVMDMHRSPHPGCQCGIYADWTPVSVADRIFSSSGHAGRLFGVIEGSGRTIIGTEGFRCEKARIVAGILTGGTKPVDLLGIPLFNSLDELLKTYSPQLPEYLNADA